MTISEDWAAAEPDHVTFGRCRSGKRWFWYASARAFGHDRPHCGEPRLLTRPDRARVRLGRHRGGSARRHAGRWHAPGREALGRGIGRPTWAADVLKQINAARRRARPPKRAIAEAAPAEYLYEPWSWTDYDNPPYETHKGINEIPIAKKTAKRIYYDRTDRGTATTASSPSGTSTGRTSRPTPAARTRARGTSRPAWSAVRTAVTSRTASTSASRVTGDPRHFRPRGCGETCPVDTAGHAMR